MRLWLDEMIPAAVAERLRLSGFDVLAVQDPQNVWAWGLDDAEQLTAAARQQRSLVTYNIRDFVPISQQWAEAGREHAGIILVHPKTVPPHDIGGLIEQLGALLETYPTNSPLHDRVVFL